MREDYYALHMVDIHCIFAITIVIPSHKYPKNSKPKTTIYYQILVALSTILLVETLYLDMRFRKL